MQYFVSYFFGLLSSFLLLLVVTQCFSCCILRPSSGLPLTEYGNYSTWEIIFKDWLLVKQGIQEIWRCYSNNDTIVFRIYQSKKHHKKREKSRTQQLKACTNICLACKMRSVGEKRVIGKIKLTSSPIMNHVWRHDYLHAGSHINYYILRLIRMWRFGIMI